jgi:hypothetical protein
MKRTLLDFDSRASRASKQVESKGGVHELRTSFDRKDPFDQRQISWDPAGSVDSSKGDFRIRLIRQRAIRSHNLIQPFHRRRLHGHSADR